MDWLTRMLQFGGTPGGILNPQGQLRTQIYPDPYEQPPQYPPLAQSLQPTSSQTNAEGQIIDANGNPVTPNSRMAPVTPQPQGQGDAAPTPQTGGDKLLSALRGVQAPRPPDVVKPATPHLPPLRPIQGGDLVAMLTSLGIQPKDLFQVPTLGASLRR